MMHAQTYNLVAKKLRDQFPTGIENNQLVSVIRGTLIDLAMSFAKSFKQDNKNFDVIKFLDQCSPDPDRYPISELWENYGGS